MDHPAEHSWVRQAQAGDRQAFAALVAEHWPRVFRWLHGLCHDTHAAEDLTQEVFLKAWSALGTFQGDSGFRAWLFRIAHNAWIDSRRGPRGETRQALPESLSHPGPGPVTAVLTREGQTLVQEACARLPDLFRAPFLLRTQENLPFRAIAQVLGITEVTVRWRVFKARNLLVRELKHYLDEKLL